MSDTMKKLVVLMLVVLLIPEAFAIVTHTHQPVMQTNIVKQGYEFARVQGFNYQDTPVNILHWHLSGETALVRTLCELQPTQLPPGPFIADIVVQCQTRSGMTSFFPAGTKVKIESFTADDVTQGAFVLEKIWVETRVEQPTAFPVTPVGHAVREEASDSTGSFLFFAGIGAIVTLTIAAMLFSLRREQE